MHNAANRSEELDVIHPEYLLSGHVSVGANWFAASQAEWITADVQTINYIPTAARINANQNIGHAGQGRPEGEGVRLIDGDADMGPTGVRLPQPVGGGDGEIIKPILIPIIPGTGPHGAKVNCAVIIGPGDGTGIKPDVKREVCVQVIHVRGEGKKTIEQHVLRIIGTRMRI